MIANFWWAVERYLARPHANGQQECERNVQIVVALSCGVRATRLARALGLSHPRVNHINRVTMRHLERLARYSTRRSPRA